MTRRRHRTAKVRRTTVRRPGAERGSRTRPADGDRTIARAFVEESRRRLRAEYLPKIRFAVSTLAAADLWWRPNPHSNAIGNLLLHLEGNVRQWILCGLGGHADRRDRDAEFAARHRAAARGLVARLARTVRAADTVLAELTAEQLLATRIIQGYQVTGLRAVYHVVEHFSGHTGQILYIAKLRRDVDLGLYPQLAPRARRRARPRRP